MIQKNRIMSAVAFAAATSAIVIVSCTQQQAKAKPNFVYKDAPKPGVLAKVGTAEITEDDLVGEEKLEFFELKKREYEFKMERLNKVIVEKMVGEEAKKEKLSLDDYIDKKVNKGEIKISDADFKKFVADRKIPEGQLNPQIKERINNYLKAQKKQENVQNYIASLTKNNPVEVYFTKPKLGINVEVGDAPFAGGKDATVTIVEFSDFQCPFCSKAAETVNQVKKKYGDKIKLAFKHFPLPMHKDAKPASEAAMCVNEQSTDKFWKFHDIMFKKQDKLDTASLEAYAKEAGADVAKFKECVTAKKYAEGVQKNLEYGEKIGVKSTPTFFINGELLSGAVPLEQFSEVIDEALAQAKR